MNICYRTMQMKDYPALSAAWRATPGIGISSADSREGIAAFLERNPGGGLIAEDSFGSIAGGVLVGHDGRRGYLYHLFVVPAYQRLGMAGKLVEAAITHLSRQGIEKSHVFVFSDNRTGRAFWEQQAWDERNDITVYSKNHSLPGE